MDRATLNQKAWYRALKVLFVLGFLFAQGFGFLITYSVRNEKISFVKCENGKEFENPYPGLEFYKFTNENDLSKRCQNQDEISVINGEKINPLDYGAVPEKLPYSQILKPRYPIIERIGLYTLSFIICSVIFWLVSRTFFYIFAKEKFLTFPVK